MNSSTPDLNHHLMVPNGVQHIKILAWNVQGAGSREFLNILREHLRMHRPSIIALFETRLSGPRAQQVCERIGFRNSFRVEAQGFQGGIWVLWNSDEFHVAVLDTHDQFVTVEINLHDHPSWNLTFVYASPQLQSRDLLWPQLQHLATQYHKPWLLVGDFNETATLEERNHSSPEMLRRCKRFQQWIDNSGLIDLGFSGPKYTWARGLSSATRKEARLDRALCNLEWRLKYQNGVVRHLIKATSDHSPLLISTGGFSREHMSNLPFRFQAAWASHGQFEEVIKHSWSNDMPLAPKLNNLAQALSRWNKEVFGNLYRRKRKLWARIEGIQQHLTTGGPSHLLKLDRKLRHELDITLDQIATMWFQKARVDQIRDGDRNTRYFHTSTIIRRRFNRVTALRMEDGSWCTDSISMQQLVVSHFRNLFSEDTQQGRSPSMPVASFPQLTEPLLQALEGPFSRLDVAAALNHMQPFKAPGPDGFHAFFFQRYWPVVQEDVCNVVLHVLNGNPMPAGINATFVTLIPKVPNPEKVTQFRPIGLCNVTYKVIARCLIDRLKPALPHLISPMQSSFVPGRQITDNIIIMQEVLHTMRRKSGHTGWMAIKLDLEKAYDRLRWDFIQDTLVEMRIPDSLVKAIMSCVTSCTLNILWNGKPSETFQPSRGVRQGDPLSPYLFVAGMDRLSQLIEAYCMKGDWQAIPITRNGTRLSHLMFADDVVLLGEASKTQAQVMMKCLLEFCQASGQKISLEKSKVYFSPNTNAATIAEICSILNMPATADFGRYLGVPTLHGRVTNAHYQDVIKRVENRLAGWKAKCLSMAGRLTLIQSTINAIPAYVMQTARLPRSVCDGLDKRVRRFLWGGTNLSRKPHLAAWDTVIKDKAIGGLGVRSMRQMNSAFLMKLGWRMKTEPSTLWTRLLKEKYCRGRDLEDISGRVHSCSNTWRGILETRDLLTKGIGTTIGDGRQTEFWNHKWMDGKILSNHILSSLPEDQRHNKVRDYWDLNKGWDWERLSQLLPAELLHRVASFDLANDILADRTTWIATKSGRFSIKSAVRIVQGTETACDSRWKWLWKIRVPYRIQTFLWLLFHRKLLTNVERFRRHIHPNPLCDVCCEEDEDLDHMLRRCSHAKETWKALEARGVCSLSTNEALHVWLQRNMMDPQVDPTWPAKFAITIWYIWKWRCALCFENAEGIPLEKDSFLCRKFQDIIHALEDENLSSPHMARNMVDRWIKWDPPERGWIALNTDGAAKGTLGPAGAGGAFRDNQGQWLMGFTEYVGHCSAAKAELRGVLRGLKIARDMHIRKLWLRVDSKTVVTWLTNKTQGAPEYYSLIQQCHHLLSRVDWEVCITHCYREANQVADILANIGTEGGLEIQIFRNPPTAVREALYADSMGISWPRQIFE